MSHADEPITFAAIQESAYGFQQISGGRATGAPQRAALNAGVSAATRAVGSQWQQQIVPELVGIVAARP
jgi:hypothetical protein